MTQLDPTALTERLREWLMARHPQVDELALPRFGRFADGGSSETFLLEPTFHVGGAARTEKWVLRVESRGHQVYQDPSVERQYRTLQALSTSTDVPVPAPLWFEPDDGVLGAPFFVMEFVEGILPAQRHHSGGPLEDLLPRDRERLWLSGVETMARIHVSDLAPFAFLEHPGHGGSGLDREIDYWDRYREWSGVPEKPELSHARTWLEDHRPVEEVASLAWGDARPGNMIFRDLQCCAVIDWETASLGGAETDLGWWIFWDWFATAGVGVPRLAGVGDGPELIAAWEGFAGRRAAAMEWHEVFATWRFAVIFNRALLLRGITAQQALRIDGRDPMLQRLDELTR